MQYLDNHTPYSGRWGVKKQLFATEIQWHSSILNTLNAEIINTQNLNLKMILAMVWVLGGYTQRNWFFCECHWISTCFLIILIPKWAQCNVKWWSYDFSKFASAVKIRIQGKSIWKKKIKDIIFTRIKPNWSWNLKSLGVNNSLKHCKYWNYIVWRCT